MHKIVDVDINLENLENYFETVPQDPYVSEGFRYKAIGRFVGKGKQFLEAEHGPLYQSLKVNPVHGNIPREYQRLSENGIPVELVKLMDVFKTHMNIPDNSEILVQAQRIKCHKDGPTAKPAVEGFHQDGVDNLGVFCVSRHMIEGGITTLSKTRDGNKPVIHTILQPGQFLLFTDENYFHYTSPIWPTEEEGYRDVVLFGNPACRM